MVYSALNTPPLIQYMIFILIRYYIQEATLSFTRSHHVNIFSYAAVSQKEKKTLASIYMCVCMYVYFIIHWASDISVEEKHLRTESVEDSVIIQVHVVILMHYFSNAAFSSIFCILFASLFSWCW